MQPIEGSDHVSKPGTNEVERGAIRRFAEALGHADQASRRGDVAPPTFPTTFRAGSDVRASLGVPETDVLQAEVTYEYERPIVAGDVITLVEWIADETEHVGTTGPMTSVTIQGEGHGADGQLVYRSRETVIIRRHLGGLA